MSVLEKILSRGIASMDEEHVKMDIQEHKDEYRKVLSLVEKNYPALEQKHIDNWYDFERLTTLIQFIHNNVV